MSAHDEIGGRGVLGVRSLGAESTTGVPVSDPIVVVREPGRTALRLVLTEPMQMGRDCGGLLLNDPQISRLHLELRVEQGQVVAEDLGSTNGTTIDGRALTGAATLGAGSVVKMGETTIELHTDVRATMITGLVREQPTVDLRATSIDIVAAAVAESRPQLADQKLDHGTISIVFSDIEASTERAEALGDQQWFDLLNTHNAIVRRQLKLHRGTEVKAQGDGFMLTFPSARAAIRCMTAVQHDLAIHNEAQPDRPIRIRVGIHTGEAIVDDDGDLFGIHVNLAARVANEAAGGEILVSSLVRQIVESRGDIDFGEARDATLKGLAGVHTMYPVIWDKT